MSTRIAVIGAGIFGVTAALALQRRGFTVILLDPGPIPHPLAESTDISKAVRMDYGADADYTVLMERAIEGWRRWNGDWGEELFHETGVLFVSREEMAPGGFEFESHALLSRRGHHVERLSGAELRARFPAWSDAYVDGYWNPVGGFAESGKVVARLVGEAKARGVELHEGRSCASLVEKAGRVVGLMDDRGELLAVDRVVLAAGSWSGHLVPEVQHLLRSVAQPVFHLLPERPEHFAAARFPVFGADIARTGYYGFPANREGIVKIANHGAGRVMHPSSAERVVTAEETLALREFLAMTFPELANAPIVFTRTCVYGDSLDEHFLIDRVPGREGLIVAAGGSGHGFKFAPVIGDLIADVVEGKPPLPKFRFRGGKFKGEEAARFRR